ncbi:hypothetical protein [Streptosporangium subroseum]|uniref:hypothetical protein n=1 Tax=Streptosporangium subroseum TaxID=106412 RepID=UPI00117CABEC|nr:hypothetical protein [Streptosporangium subroseum]
MEKTFMLLSCRFATFPGAVYRSLSAFPGTVNIAQKGTIRTKVQLPTKAIVSGAERFRQHCGKSPVMPWKSLPQRPEKW